MREPLTSDRGPVTGTERRSAEPLLTRRRILRAAGTGGAVFAVAAVGGGTVRAIDQGVFATGEGPAYAAWSDWRGHRADGSLNLVRAAVLAANAHNAQPWLFRVDASSIDVFGDPSRGTGANDPLGRELMISLGCAVENIMVAAGPNGFVPSIMLFPDPADPSHAGRIDLTAGAVTASTLYEAIPRRHTNRAAFEDRPIPAETLTELTNINDDPDLAVIWLTSAEEKTTFAELTVAATEAFVADDAQSLDSFRWWRGDWDELQRRKDGLTVDTTGLSPLMRALGKLAPGSSRATNDETWLSTTKHPQCATAAAFGIIAARDHRADAQRFQAGRLYQRLQLWATDAELAMQPLNQAVERRDRELELGLQPVMGDSLVALMPDMTWQVVMPFRIGYPRMTALKSPRRPAADVVLG